MLPPLSELRGLRVFLRRPRERDRTVRLGYGRNPEFVRMIGGDASAMPPLTAEEVGRWYDQLVSEPYGWSIEYEGRFVGAARLNRLDLEKGSAWYAIGLHDSSVWGRGLGTEATQLVLAFAFDRLCLLDVLLRVLEYNHRAVAAYKKSGFVLDYVERDTVVVSGKRHSNLVMRASVRGRWRFPGDPGRSVSPW